MFNFNKKMVAAVLAGVMTFGVASTAMLNVTEAASKKVVYEDGTTNKYSHRMKAEEKKHEQKVRFIHSQHKQGKISDKEHDKQIKKEQQRHDKEMKDIKRDYEAHNHKKSK